MATIELKISQVISSFNQDPLFVFFLDMRKSYDTVDRVASSRPWRVMTRGHIYEISLQTSGSTRRLSQDKMVTKDRPLRPIRVQHRVG